MLDRESTFADQEIIKMLQTQFIPVAIDQAYQRRQKDAEGEFYRKVATQGPRSNMNGTTQGLYVCGADGSFLGYTNNRGPDRTKQLIRKALDSYSPSHVSAIDKGKSDERFNPTLPEGGLIVRVNSKVLGGYEDTSDPWQRIFQTAISRDNLWISPSERQALAGGIVPSTLQKRIARFHLVDNTRGEPPMWDEDEVKHIEMNIRNGQLTGNVHLETKSGERGYKASLLGHVESKEGQVVKFNVVAKGNFWGEGPYTRNAPKGKFPLGVSFTLADGSEAADKIPPQGSRGWLAGYLR